MSENTEAQEPAINFMVHNIYVKDVSFEAPNTPMIFNREWNPKLDFDIEMDRQELPNDLYEVSLSVTVTVSLLDEKEAANSEGSNKTEKGAVAFLIEAKQAGIFLLEGAQDEWQKDYILSTTAPNILFPYIREIVTNLVAKGGFPQLVLPPINFEDMYRQHMEQQRQQAEAATKETADA